MFIHCSEFHQEGKYLKIFVTWNIQVSGSKMNNLKILHNKKVEDDGNKLPVYPGKRVETMIPEMNQTINRKSTRNV